MVAYTYQMPSGIPGTVTRYEQATIEAQMIDPAHNFTAFGLPAKMVSGLIRPIEAGDTNTNLVGFLAKPYPTSGNGTDGLGVATPVTQFPADLLTRGYMNVQVNGATAPLKNGIIYIRVGGASAGKPIGGIEAAADGGNTFAVSYGLSHFTGGEDANGNSEIAFNI